MTRTLFFRVYTVLSRSFGRKIPNFENILKNKQNNREIHVCEASDLPAYRHYIKMGRGEAKKGEARLNANRQREGGERRKTSPGGESNMGGAR